MKGGNELLRLILLGVESIIPTDEELESMGMSKNEVRWKCNYCNENDARYVLDIRDDQTAPLARNEANVICEKCFEESEIVEAEETS